MIQHGACLAVCHIRVVIRLGKVGQKQGFEAVMEEITQECPGIGIGKMAVAGLDSLLEMPGVRAILEHLFVMVEFQHQRAAAFQFIPDQSGGHAEIGGTACHAIAPLDGEPHRVNGFVGQGDRINEQIALDKRAPRFKLDNFNRSKQRGDPTCRERTGHHRNFQAPRQRPHPPDMIGVFVGYQDGG